mmetsp:Transcript_36817/g.80214  ORF Transcript_36817/g.80214 Transcript_36817/m.80214 type:complete len:491 (-) Transcript_36817:147-1619(-)|eukprot:CAMPEP_0118930094 /NCGR_PEP_ID=MMETSP1169-20130426/6895_1 /TAXON_ID=36882 /ORGANISM="Pyramimonas obovata, Strain CCMP722" /LENGTH=490 /DNA_ID=CAMNT_0006872397 /DNA_START=88 /DNA_END=1560 /DNA_ORIENTATION=+
MDPNMTVVDNFAANCTATVGKILGDIGVANAVNDLTEVLCAMKASTEAAQEAADGVGGSLDGSFMLANTYLVFFMQAGFAMLCAGSVRSKNCMNILLKNVLDACFGAPMYWAFGYAFAYGEGSSTNGFIGNNDFFLDDFTDWPFFIFQWAFAAATATIVSGSVAERCTFQAYIIYSMFLTGFVYPVVSHWIWASQGWLSAFNPDALVWDSGMIDFAGSGVVHMTGGFAGLMGAAIIGPRSGRFQSDGSPSPNFQGHSVTLVVLGTFILWFGWYGFNPGSMLAINGAVETVSRTAVTTTISAAAGGVSSLMWNFGKSKTWDLSQACNGVLSGLVGITAGCSVVDPAAALLIGALSGVLFDLGSTMLLKLKIDDPLGAAPMHGFCGAFGVIMVGLFARKEYVVQAYAPSGQIQYGMFFGGGWKLLGCQFLGVFSIMAWVCTLIGGIFMIMKAAGILRVPVDEEILGLDISHHGGKAYNLDENTVTSTEMSAR